MPTLAGSSTHHRFRASTPLGQGSVEELVEGAREVVAERLHETGAVLFRDFVVDSPAAFEAAVTSVTPELRDYDYASTPRTKTRGRIYTSTEYPPHQRIPLHSEMSYSTHWPRWLWFFCHRPATCGGATPLADIREVYRTIDAGVRRRFAERKVLYVRNYGTGLDLDWQQAFNTEDPQTVEAYCDKLGLDFEWKSDGVLKTWQICQGVAEHPLTGEEVWFNQAHLFHVSALAPEVREALLDAVDEEDLPRNAYYGDGTPIEEAALDEVRCAFETSSVEFAWQSSDVLLVDNMLVAHGRAQFTGPRTVLVAMA